MTAPNIILHEDEGDFDLFAGAGGASEGLDAATAEVGQPVRHLTAVNHDETALATHKANHPHAHHFCEDIRRVDPVRAMGGRRVRIGLAGPDCTDHSNAKGGRPRSAGLRALAWDVVRWARHTQPRHLLIENVPEFTGWGPLGEDGTPVKARRGEYFAEFLASLGRLGYRVDWRILRACDYGDATTRRRLFIQGSRDGGRIVWPRPAYGDPGNLFGLPAYRAAREIIDWELPCPSIFDRKKRLAANTEARIAEGVLKFCGGPFLLGIGGPRGRQKVATLDAPYRTVLTHCHDYLCVPMLLRYNDGGRIQSVDQPLTTIDTSNRHALVQAFLVAYYGNGGAHSVDAPLPTITTRDKFALVEVEKRLADKGLYIADIRMRMLAAHEYAAAHSFPPGYRFIGNDKQVKAQLGHSWPVRMAKSAIRAMLTGEGEVLA